MISTSMLKSKIPWRFITIFALVVVLCLGCAIVFDDVFNGMLVDWFEKNYSVMSTHYDENTQRQVTIYRPDWSKVKELFFFATASILLIIGILTLFATKIYASFIVKRRLKIFSALIHQYIISDKDAAEVFPEKYDYLAIEMREVKETLKNHEKRLQEETAKKNDLITYLAHDLKTPLTSVIGFLSLLREAPDMPANIREKYINVAFQKALRLERLINEFFDITRFNLQQVHMNAETFDLSYLLMQLTDELLPLAHKHNNQLQLDKPEELIMFGDAENLARVFTNVLKNAIAYSYSDTDILIKARQLDEHVQISFINHGPTIPSDKLPLLFEKFYRLDSARSTETGGAGLGLAIAKEILTLHSGTITAESNDHITQFTITLPANLNKN
ncbi:MAG: HAMP domain-containing sensor histidine kinase [Peptococcaceae bacterium]|nr:HAMP domain-containing sensor histidine kinase [Peptococcaceae bacterium]